MSRLLNALSGVTPQGRDANGSTASIAADNAQLGRSDQGRDLIEEMAQALARYSPPGPEQAAPSVFHIGSANVPAPLPINDFEDDFPDDGPVPIPSTWLQQKLNPEPSWFRTQARAAAIGLGGGLAVIIPLVLVVSGQASKLQAALLSGPELIPPKVAERSPAQPRIEQASQPAPKPRIIVTTPVTTTPVAPPPAAETAATPVEARVIRSETIPPAPMVASLAPAPSTPTAVAALAPPAAEPKSDRKGELRKRGEEQVAAGEIGAARQVLAEAAAAGDMEAALLLGETFDPNMLAAWGIKGATPDVGVALIQYRKALGAGIERARVRIKALE
jgi:hypothetical protein